jgi:hypothetical protein
LRLHRIVAGLSRAARSGTIFHLWWHPHNGGVDTDHYLRFLERVLQRFRHLTETHGMRSSSMLEIAQEWSASAQPAAPAPPGLAAPGLAAPEAAEHGVAEQGTAGRPVGARRRSRALGAVSEEAVQS